MKRSKTAPKIGPKRLVSTFLSILSNFQSIPVDFEKKVFFDFFRFSTHRGGIVKIEKMVGKIFFGIFGGNTLKSSGQYDTKRISSIRALFIDESEGVGPIERVGPIKGGAYREI